MMRFSVRRVLALYFLALLLLPTSGEGNDDAYRSLIEEHLDLYPSMQAADIYKLLYQATRGPGHYGLTYEPVRAYLEHEVAGMDSAQRADTLLIVPLGPRFCRLHIAPYLARGGSLDSLAHAQVASAAAEQDTLAFLRIWRNCLTGVWSEVDQAAPPSAFAQLDSLARVHNWPAVHHSELYRASYDPHYRVLLLEEALRLTQK